MTARVEKIINGNTIVVSPPWKVGNKTGMVIIIKGYEVKFSPNISFKADSPSEIERANDQVVNRLEKMILNKFIEIREVEYSQESINEDNRLTCPVYFNGTDVSDWFMYLVKPADIKYFNGKA